MGLESLAFCTNPTIPQKCHLQMLDPKGSQEAQDAELSCPGQNHVGYRL